MTESAPALCGGGHDVAGPSRIVDRDAERLVADEAPLVLPVGRGVDALGLEIRVGDVHRVERAQRLQNRLHLVRGDGLGVIARGPVAVHGDADDRSVGLQLDIARAP